MRTGLSSPLKKDTVPDLDSLGDLRVRRRVYHTHFQVRTDPLHLLVADNLKSSLVGWWDR